MKRVCDEIRPEADFVLIDSPAGIERGFRNAIAPADRVLVITNPEVSAVRDADRVIGILEPRKTFAGADHQPLESGPGQTA